MKKSVFTVNAVTISRLPLTFIGCMFMYRQEWLASWLFIVGGMLGTDMIDGPLARKLKAETKFGVNADKLCDVVANWILVGGWCFYAYEYFAWLNWLKITVLVGVLIVMGILFFLDIEYDACKGLLKRIWKWFSEDMGDFFFGTTVAGLIIMWLAFNANLLVVYITIFSGLAAVHFNWEKVSDFRKSAFLQKGDS